jgi:hypothetical protein
MPDVVYTFLWTRVRVALESRGALLPGHPTAMEAAQHAQSLLGSDLVVRFVTEYYQERVYGGGDGLSDSDAERIVAELEVLSIRTVVPSSPCRATASVSLKPPSMLSSTARATIKIATDDDEAMGTGWEELRAQEEREAEEMRRQREVTETAKQHRLAAEEQARFKQQEVYEQERGRRAREIAAQSEAARRAEEERIRAQDTQRRAEAQRIALELEAERPRLTEQATADQALFVRAKQRARPASDEGKILLSQAESQRPKPSGRSHPMKWLRRTCLFFSFVFTLFVCLHIDYSACAKYWSSPCPGTNVPLFDKHPLAFDVTVGTPLLFGALWLPHSLRYRDIRSEIFDSRLGWGTKLFYSLISFYCLFFLPAVLISAAWKIDMVSAVSLVIGASAGVGFVRFVFEKLSTQKTKAGNA